MFSTIFIICKQVNARVLQIHKIFTHPLSHSFITEVTFYQYRFNHNRCPITGTENIILVKYARKLPPLFNGVSVPFYRSRINVFFSLRYMEGDRSCQRATLFVNINFEYIKSIMSNTTLTITSTNSI